MTSNEKITMRQLQVLIILSAMGTGAIVLPRLATEYLPVQNVWVVAVGLAVLAVAVGVLICAAARAAQEACDGSFLEMVSFLLTRPVAYAICIALWFKIVVAAGFEIRIFLELSRDVMLPNTPMWVVGGVMILACAYAAGKGIETRARVAEVLFALMAVPVLLLFAVALFDVDFSNLRPLYVGDTGAAIRGTLRLGFVLTGLECLLLVTPYVPRERSMARAVAGALALAGLLIVALTTITIAALGSGAATELWPVLRLMDAISLPGAFIERQEALMFGFWIITAFMLGNAMLFFGGTLLKDLRKAPADSGHLRSDVSDVSDFVEAEEISRVRKGGGQRAGGGLHAGVAITAAAVFGVTLLPFSPDEIFRQMNFMYATSGVFFLLVLPLALLIAAKITVLGRYKILAKMAAFAILMAFAGLLLTGCWDKVEIEERAFVVAVGIDAVEGEYKVTLSVPIFSDEEENEDAHIKTAQSATVADALAELAERDERQLFYGQTQMIIFGNTLINDPDLLPEAVAELNKNLQATQRIHVLSAESAADVLAKTPHEKIIPYAEKSIMNFYDFEKLIASPLL